MKNDKDFELIYNAFSVGWHLRKIMEVSPNVFVGNEARFAAWLQRHGIKVK